MGHLVDALEGQVFGLEPRRRFAPQRLTDGERLVEQAAPPFEIEARRLILLALPADADSEVEAPGREDVDGGRGLRQDHRSTEGSEQDPRRQPHPGRDAAQCGQDGQGLEPVSVRARRLPAALLPADFRSRVRVHVLAEHDVVRDEDAVDAGVVRSPGHLEQRPPAVGARIVRRVRAQHDRQRRRAHQGFRGLFVQRPLPTVRNHPPAASVPPSVGMT